MCSGGDEKMTGLAVIPAIPQANMNDAETARNSSLYDKVILSRQLV